MDKIRVSRGFVFCVIPKPTERIVEFLLVQRAHNDSFMPGCWELPGGKARQDETLTETLQREVFEETALELDDPFGVPWRHEADDVSVIYAPFQVKERKIVLSPAHATHAWLRPKDLNMYAHIMVPDSLGAVRHFTSLTLI